VLSDVMLIYRTYEQEDNDFKTFNTSISSSSSSCCECDSKVCLPYYKLLYLIIIITFKCKAYVTIVAHLAETETDQ